MLSATAAAFGGIVFASIALAAWRVQRAQRRQHKLSAAFVRAQRSWQPYDLFSVDG